MNFKAVSIAAAVCVFIGATFAAAAAPLRRPISLQTPMFLFQVQQSDPADPQADINAVPADLRPYTVMMYCLSAQSGTQTNGYALADYFCNVCQQNGAWCMVQVASGYANTMDNTNTADYVTLLQKYPNLISWQTLLTINPVAFPFAFLDVHSATNAARFYRIQIGP